MRKGVARSSFSILVLGFVLGSVVSGSAVFFLLQQAIFTKQLSSLTNSDTAPALEKFKVSGYAANRDASFLLLDAAQDRGIWAKYGLDPEFVFIPNRFTSASDIKNQVASGIKIGMIAASDVVLARLNGTSVKIVAGYTGLPANKVYVLSDSPIKTAKDLDGRKLGVFALNDVLYRHTLYMNNKLGINPELVPLGNFTNQIVALKIGRVDAIVVSEGAALRLVDSGELRIVVNLKDEVYPKPWIAIVVWATDDLIEQNSDLVKSFVKATLETASYLKENPGYVSDLYINRTNAPRDLADKAAAQIDWQPSGRGTGSDLKAAVKTVWQFHKDSGGVPANVDVNIDEAVDTRFLP